MGNSESPVKPSLRWPGDGHQPKLLGRGKKDRGEDLQQNLGALLWFFFSANLKPKNRTTPDQETHRGEK